MLDLDSSSEFGARVLRRLEQEEVIWLTTVRADGLAQPSPVWFLWNGETLLVYSQPDTPKLRNINGNPQVALNLNSDATGGDVVVISGTAAIDEQPTPAAEEPAYLSKYRSAIVRMGADPAQFMQSYSVAIRIRPARVRGH